MKLQKHLNDYIINSTMTNSKNHKCYDKKCRKCHGNHSFNEEYDELYDDDVDFVIDKLQYLDEKITSLENKIYDLEELIEEYDDYLDDVHTLLSLAMYKCNMDYDERVATLEENNETIRNYLEVIGDCFEWLRDDLNKDDDNE